MTRSVPVGEPVRVLREATVASLLAGVAPDLSRLEASGVTYADGRLWVIFDNLADVAAIDPALRPGPGHNRLVRQGRPPSGYEDVAWDDGARRGFALIEAARAPDGELRPQIDEFDAGWRPIARRWVDLVVDRPNKGLEGLSCVRRDGGCYLLALAEEGIRAAGGSCGVVHVLARDDDRWRVHDRIVLPAGLGFPDFSGLSLRGNRIAVVSQEASALWVGELEPDRWRVTGAGRVHPFPTDRRGRLVYGTVEGLCWLDEHTIAAVSDRAKPGHPRRFRRTAESVHVVALPPTLGRSASSGPLVRGTSVQIALLDHPRPSTVRFFAVTD